ncbi:MAG: methionine adenosyltransferase [Bryobacterales bacterium]|nr:methionine adenosyltransferase [Bryobacterales bacterium]
MHSRLTQLFTSESVTAGHPDKLCDKVSDAVLDGVLAQDPQGRVACETLVTTNLCVLSGEIRTEADLDLEAIARDTIRDIGYNDPTHGFDAATCRIKTHVHEQSADIAMGVDTGGAGDQGLMFGYACRETEDLMPLPIMLAHQLVRQLSDVRDAGGLGFLRPDGKSQVTVEYDGDDPARVDAVVVSTQHDPVGGPTLSSQEELRQLVKEVVIDAVVPREMTDERTQYHINPTGQFEIGGPHGDTGLTGRKIIVDTYGGMGRHGGGAFSGKDPTKVDRSACYMARYIAKNIVAAELASRCEVQLAYAIGVADPVSVRVDTYGTGKADEAKLVAMVREIFPLTPAGLIDALDLRRPIYKSTAAYGHFGRREDTFTWERTDKVDELITACR